MTQTEFRNTWLPLSDALYRVAFYMLEDESDAKDVVQDLYVKRLAKSPEDVRNPKAYAMTMLRNMCIDRIRTAQKFFSIECSEGFNSIYGSHHKFYGAMDFFYIGTYVNGFTPGLQNLYFSGTYNPTRQLSFQAAYHYMAMATSHNDWDRTLGHEIELEGSYRFLKEAKLSAGFSFMTGTGTMEKLKRASDDGSLRWAWLSLTVSPTIFTARW